MDELFPLSALRFRLDEGSVGLTWQVDPEGLRVLVQPAGKPVAYSLRLPGPIRLTGRVQLVPPDWRGGSGSARASITVTDAHGTRREAFSAVLPAAQEHGYPEGAAIDCVIPADTVTLTLAVEPHQLRDGPSVSRAMWIDPQLGDPTHTDDHPASTEAHPPPEVPHDPDHGPLISVLTPVHDPPPEMLEEAIASVTTQTYPGWQLCLVDDGSQNREIIAALERHASCDPRITLQRHPTAQGISAATNTALAAATGAYIALLDHDDTLHPHALAHIAHTVTTDPTLDMIYTDEDIVLDGRAIWTHLKPAWSPETLQTNGYTCHLGVYRAARVRELGGFRSEYDGSQDVDLILRLVERTDRIAHVPRILYHWRIHPASTAGGDAKPYAYVSAQRAITQHLQRVGVEGRVDYGPPGLYRVVHRVVDAASVEFVIGAVHPRVLRRCAASWLAQPHARWAVRIAASEAELSACRDALVTAGVTRGRIVSVLVPDDTPGPEALAAAVAHGGDAEYLLLMPAVSVGLTHDWLRRLIGYVSQDRVAAAGPVVVGADGRVSHGGVALPDGLALHLLYGRRTSIDEHFGFGTSTYNVSALDGAAMMRAEVVHELGGLDHKLREMGLVGLTMRAAATGSGRVVTVPDARVRALAGEVVANDLASLAAVRAAWLAQRSDDPYYNPGLRRDCGDFAPVALLP